MIKRTITYENPFTEEKVTETHYFHISKADLVEMELEEHKDTYVNRKGEELTGMQAKLTRIAEAEDGKAIIDTTKDLIRRAYGIKDGEKFRKSAAIWDEFSSSEAFSQLFFELTTDAEKSAEFMNGIIPNNLDQIAEEVKQAAAKADAAEKLGTREPTPAEGDPTGLITPTPPANEDHAREASPFENPDLADLRAKAIINATPEDPVTLTQNEVVAMDHTKMKEGLSDGRFKLS